MQSSRGTTFIHRCLTTATLKSDRIGYTQRLITGATDRGLLSRNRESDQLANHTQHDFFSLHSGFFFTVLACVLAPTARSLNAIGNCYLSLQSIYDMHLFLICILITFTHRLCQGGFYQKTHVGVCRMDTAPSFLNL